MRTLTILGNALRPINDVLYGLHSNIPLCCVLAFVTSRTVAVEDFHYRPCRRCAHRPETARQLHHCRESSRFLCRVYGHIGAWLFSTREEAEACPFCHRRGFKGVDEYDEETDTWRDSEEVGVCVFCDTLGARDGSWAADAYEDACGPAYA